MVLYLCLLAAGIFVAWQFHLYWRRSETASFGQAYRDQTAGPATQAAFLNEGTESVSELIEPLTDPLFAEQAVGMKRLKGDPAGLQPPAGAKRRFGFQRFVADSVEQQASYALPGELAGIADHYRQALRAAGFELLEDSVETSEGLRPRQEQSPPDISRAQGLMVAKRGRNSVVVVMRKNKTHPKIVEVSVTAICPGRR